MSSHGCSTAGEEAAVLHALYTHKCGVTSAGAIKHTRKPLGATLRAPDRVAHTSCSVSAGSTTTKYARGCCDSDSASVSRAATSCTGSRTIRTPCPPSACGARRHVKRRVSPAFRRGRLLHTRRWSALLGRPGTEALQPASSLPRQPHAWDAQDDI